jgi:hypothetical protein
MNDLKPCPKCFDKAFSFTDDSYGISEGYQIRCKDVFSCSMSTRWFDTEEAAIEAWNTRPKCEDCRYCGQVKLKYAWCNVFECSFGIEHYCAEYEAKEEK